MSRVTSPIEGKNFQIESILGMIEDDILLDDRTRGIHDVAGKIILTWHRNGEYYLSIVSTLTI
jgi:hypothetical protein